MEPTKEEVLAAKREARRRKLLENAKDRLSRITGREHNDDDAVPTGKKLKSIFERFYGQTNLYHSISRIINRKRA